MLTQQQIETYHADGYLVVEDVLDPHALEALRRETDRIVASASGLVTHDQVFDLEDSYRPDRPRVRRIKEPHAVSRVFAELTRHPNLVAIFTVMLGPDVRLKTTKLNLKSGEYGAPVEWHQDWAFYPHTNHDLLVLGVMLDEADEENGPLLVIPGSHRGPTYDHHATFFFSRYTEETEPDDSRSTRGDGEEQCV